MPVQMHRSLDRTLEHVLTLLCCNEACADCLSYVTNNSDHGTNTVPARSVGFAKLPTPYHHDVRLRWKCQTHAAQSCKTLTWMKRKMKSGMNMVVVKPVMAPHTTRVPRSRRLWVTFTACSPPTQSVAE